MDALTIISILFSLVLIYFLGSTLVSLIVELWNHLRNGREKFLEKRLTEHLGADAAKEILKDPLISGTSNKAPKQISADHFGAVASKNLTRTEGDVCHQIVQAASKKSGLETISGTTTTTTADPTKTPPKTENVTTTTENSTAGDPSSAEGNTTPENTSTPNDTATPKDSTATSEASTSSGASASAESSVSSGTASSGASVSHEHQALSDWYKDFSTQMSADFKSALRIPSLVVSIFVVVILNLDTLNIIRTLWEDPETSTEIFKSASGRDWGALIQQDSGAVDPRTTEEQLSSILNLLNEIDSLESKGLPIGWHSAEKLGLVIPPHDSSTTFKFQLVTSVDTSGGASNTSRTFKYLPPEGANAFRSNGEIQGEASETQAVFGTTVPSPEPELKEENGALILSYENVLGDLDSDSLRSVFEGINNDIYSFRLAAHLPGEHPGLGTVIVENVKTIDFVQIIGWLISIICIGMGASFWYDILKKLVNLGTGGKAPKT